MDWEQFLTDHNVEFVTRGPNTKRGEVSIQCPFCGVDDPSHHMGISLERELWGCHRSASHRGMRPHRLVATLLGCSFNQATLVVRQYSQADPETFDDILNLLDEKPEAEKPQPVEPLHLLPEFKKIKPYGMTGRFWRYLNLRGFNMPDLVVSRYKLRCCLLGRWKQRIIFPIYKGGKLVEWTARAIVNPIEAPRYLTNSKAIKTLIYEEDRIMEGGDVLFITEGPFDAIKLDFHSVTERAKATCVFGTSITHDQMMVLRSASKRYGKTVLMLDPDAAESTFNTAEWLPGAIIGSLPTGVEDPGDLTASEARWLVKSYL